MKNLILLSLLISCTFSFSQNINYAKSTISILASPEMEGRGYVNNGDKKAAAFISSEFKKMKLNSFDHHYFQKLSFPINTIVEDYGISIDAKSLVPGVEYMIDPSAESLNGIFEMVYLPDSFYDNKNLLKQFFSQDLSKKFILTEGRFHEMKRFEFINARGIVFINHTKLTWHASRADKVHTLVVIEVLDSVCKTTSRTIRLNFKNKFLKEHKTQNVIGFVKGKLHPDSFFVVTAHYDHLGRMGQNVYFPGANDNASGTAMMMDLASYFSNPQNQPDYSIVFIALCGEEAGLLGSTYCADNPPFSLQKVKFLINLDMVGTGSEGITVVNATIFKDAFSTLQKINTEKNYVTKVNAREESCNSDHCPFYKKGVPSVFIYSLGKEYLEYHNVNDQASKLPLTDYEDIFRLMRDFIQTY